MKLELKDVALYLPYNVRFVSELDIPYFEYGKNPIWTAQGISEMFDDLCFITKEKNDTYPIYLCKMILRPLSELNVDGEINTPEYLQGCCYSYVNSLLPEHWDVFGLIEQGLAIDINAL